MHRIVGIYLVTTLSNTLEIYCSYPLHSQASGSFQLDFQSVSVDGLERAYLDYAVALATLSDKTVVLNFLPDGVMHAISVGDNVTDLMLWSPSRNNALSSQIISANLMHISECTQVELLRKIVRSKLGDKIDIYKIRKGAEFD